MCETISSPMQKSVRGFPLLSPDVQPSPPLVTAPVYLPVISIFLLTVFSVLDILFPGFSCRCLIQSAALVHYSMAVGKPPAFQLEVEREPFGSSPFGEEMRQQ